MTNVLNHVRTRRHQELKKEFEHEHLISKSEEGDTSRHEDIMQPDGQHDVASFDKRQSDGGSDDEMAAHLMVESPL